MYNTRIETATRNTRAVAFQMETSLVDSNVFSLCRIHKAQFDIWSVQQPNQCTLRKRTSLSSNAEVLAPLNILLYLIFIRII